MIPHAHCVICSHQNEEQYRMEGFKWLWEQHVYDLRHEYMDGGLKAGQ